MRRCLFVFLIVSVFAQFALAQSTAVSRALVSDPVVTNSRSDSVLAVHRLFQSRRTSGKILTIGAVPIALGATFVGALISLGNFYNRTGSPPNPFVDGIAGGVMLSGLLPGIVGIPQLIRFKKKREKAIISAYEQGSPLPVYVRRRLKPKYFH
jgi:hypothetical protein